MGFLLSLPGFGVGPWDGGAWTWLLLCVSLAHSPTARELGGAWLGFGWAWMGVG